MLPESMSITSLVLNDFEGHCQTSVLCSELAIKLMNLSALHQKIDLNPGQLIKKDG